MPDQLFGLTFLTVCVLYAGALLIGWHLTRRGRLDVVRVMESRRAFTDPLTGRFQRWCQAYKMAAIRQQRWGRLRLLIFANNLGAVAFVGRTLYSVVLAPAVYLTYRQGLSHGTLAAQQSMRLPRTLIMLSVLEFGAYLLATALGLNLVVTPIAGGAFQEALGLLVVFYPVVAVALLLAAWLEVNELRSRMTPGFRLQEGLNMEQLRAKALEMMKHSAGNQGYE